tara:strand:- start:529 stop:885 length:357 start_codon:yes stop_codon:yes gene_type:complete
MRLFKAFILPILTLIISVPAFAGDTLIIGDDDDSVITGIIKDIQFSEIIMDVNGQSVEVDIDNLNIEEDIDIYFPVGSKITVEGRMQDSDEITATKIIRLQIPETELIDEDTVIKTYR